LTKSRECQGNFTESKNSPQAANRENGTESEKNKRAYTRKNKTPQRRVKKKVVAGKMSLKKDRSGGCFKKGARKKKKGRKSAWGQGEKWLVPKPTSRNEKTHRTTNRQT